MKFLKPILAIILSCTLLCGCETKESFVTNYDDGYTDGYLEGIEYAKKEIASLVEEYYSDIYSSELYNAITALSIYADGIYEKEYGEPMPEEKLQSAIQKLLEYQKNVEQLIYDIDEMEIN